jgi:DNA-binding SARP family transcriptional activator
VNCHIRTFGSLQLFCGERSCGHRLSQSSRTLIALLALRYGRSVRREEIVNLLWAADYDKKHRRRLSTILWRLNQLAISKHGAGEIVRIAGDGDVRIEADAHTIIDLAEFETIFKAIPARVEQLRCGDVASIERAVDLHRGDLLEDIDAEWVSGARAHTRQCHLDLLQLLIEYFDNKGAPDRVIAYANHYIQIDPYVEFAHLALVKAYGMTGRLGLAASHADICRRVLVEDLGVPLSSETERVFASLVPGRLVVRPRKRRGAPRNPAPNKVSELRSTLSQLLTTCAALLDELPPGKSSRS